MHFTLWRQSVVSTNVVVVSLSLLLCCSLAFTNAEEHQADDPSVVSSEQAEALLLPDQVVTGIENATTWLKEGDQVFEEDSHVHLFPLDVSDYIGFALCLVGLMLAAGGGIGGGGILIPIYILVMDFSPKHAIPLSNVTVLGGAIANILLYSKQRHPIADRPLIDWWLILVMEPFTIAGAIAGTLIYSLLSETTIVIMLIVLLSYTAKKTLTKAVKLYRKETLDLHEERNKASGSELAPLVANKENGDDNESQLENGTDSTVSKELAQILKEERTAPIGAIMALVALFSLVLVVNLAKGGGAFESPLGIECGSAAFWIANGIILLAALVVTMLVRSWLVHRYEIKEWLGYRYVEGDIRWDSRATILYPSICCLAGLAAGMFGVGGGIVKGPLMLAMGVHPSVASATSATMILFTSATATTSYIVFGLLIPEYAVVFFVFGFISTFLGQILLAYLMKRHARNSYIAFSIGGVVLISAILMTIQSLLSLWEGEEHSANGICGIDA